MNLVHIEIDVLSKVLKIYSSDFTDLAVQVNRFTGITRFLSIILSDTSIILSQYTSSAINEGFK